MRKRFFTPHRESLKVLHAQQERKEHIQKLRDEKLKQTDPKHAKSFYAQKDMERFINILDPQDLSEIITMGEMYTRMIGPLKNDFKTNADMLTQYEAIKDFAPQFMNEFLMEEGIDMMPRYETSQQLIEKTVKLDKKIQMQLMPFRSPVTLKESVDSYNYFMNAIQPNGKGALIFDFETLAGMQLDKVKAFDTITEFSYLDIDTIGTPEEMQKKAVGYLIGINDKLANRYKSMFREGKPKKTDGYIDVVSRRLALYGHENTRFHQTARGAYVIDQLADLPDNYVPTVDELMKGINLLNKAYHADQATLDTKGTHLTETQEAYSHMLGIIYNSEKAISGYNIKRADLIWNKLYLQQLPPETREQILKNAGLDPTKPLPSGYDKRFFDLFQYIHIALHGTNAAEIYKDKNIDFKNSLFTQETMAGTFLEELVQNLVSHGATNDVVINSQLFTNKDFLERFQKGITNLSKQKNMQTPLMEFAPKRQLFLANQLLGMGSPFDFVLTPDNQIHYMSGFGLEFQEKIIDLADENPSLFPFEATKNGLLIDSIGGSILHKNSLYSIADIGIVKTTPEMQKAAQKINSDYAQEELFYMVFEGYDRLGTLSSLSREVRFYRSEEEMLAQLNLNPVVGMKHSGGFKPSLQDFKPLDPKVYQEYINSVTAQVGKIDLSQQKSAYGKPKLLPIDYKTVIDDALETERTSRVKDVMRKPDFKKINRMRQVANLISKDETDTYFKEQSKQGIDYLFFEGNIKTGVQVAARFANGKSYTLHSSEYEKIVNSIGFDDIRAQHKRLNRSTSDNIFGLSEFYYHNNQILDPILEFINQSYGQDKETAQLAFEHMMSYVQNRITEDLDYNKEKQARPMIKRLNELNYIEVDRYKLSPEPRKFYKYFNTSADLSDMNEYLKITVGEENDYLKLINTLLNERYHTTIDPKTEDYRLKSFVVLNDFVKALSEDKELGKTIRKNIGDIEEYDRPEEMASAIMGVLRAAKEKHPLIGIKRKTEYRPPIDIFENGNALIAEKLQENPRYIEEMVDELSLKMPAYVKLFNDGTGEITPSITREYVREHLLKPYFESDASVKEVLKDPLAYSRKYGQDEKLAQYFNTLINQTEEDYTDSVAGLLYEFGQIPGFELFENEEGVFAKYGDDVLNISDKLVRLVANDGNVSLRLGKQNLSLHGELLANGQKYSPDSVEFATNLKKAYREGWFSWRQAVRRVKNEGASPLVELDKAFSQWGSAIRETSTFDKENINNLHGNYRVGITDLYKQILYAQKEGQLKRRVAGHEIDPDVISVAQRILDLNHGEVPEYPVYDATFKQVIAKNIYDVLEIVSGHSAFQPEHPSDIPVDKVTQAIRLISPVTSEKDAANGLYSVGHQHAPFSGFAKTNRITLGQNNFNYFSTHDAVVRTAKAYTGKTIPAEEAAEFLKSRGVMIGSILHNGYTYELEDLESLGTQIAYQITGNKVLVSDKEFHRLIDKQLSTAKTRADKISDLAAREREQRKLTALQIKLKQYSLLEDQTINNPRIYDSIFQQRDANFFRSETIYQSPKHKEINDLAATQFHIKRDEKGNFVFSYGKGIEKNLSNILFYSKDKHGDKGKPKLAAYDGTFKLGFFDPNHKRLITEDEINAQMKDFKSQKEVDKFIESLSENAFFYLEPKEPEEYRKTYSTYVEKSKGLGNVFNIGEYDKELKERLGKYLSPEEQKRFFDRMDSSDKDIEEILEIIRRKESTGIVNARSLRKNLKTQAKAQTDDFNAKTTERINGILEQIQREFIGMNYKATPEEKAILNNRSPLNHKALNNVYGFIKKAYSDIYSVESEHYIESLQQQIIDGLTVGAIDISRYSNKFLKQLYEYTGEDKKLVNQIRRTQVITKDQVTRALELIKAKLDNELDRKLAQEIYQQFEENLGKGFYKDFNVENLNKITTEYQKYLTSEQLKWFEGQEALNENQIAKFFKFIRKKRYQENYHAKKQEISELIHEQETGYRAHINYKNLPADTINMLYSHLSPENKKKWDSMPVVTPAQFNEFLKAMEQDVTQANMAILTNAEEIVSQYRKDLNDERFAVFDFVQDALLQDLRAMGYDPGDIMQITSENNPKHGDISKNMSETFLTLQRLRERAYGETPEEASANVTDFLAPFMPGAERKNLKAKGVLAVPDNYELDEYKYRDLVEAINAHPDYQKFFAPGNIMGIPLAYDNEGNPSAVLSVAQLAQAKEYEYATYAMPVSSTPEMHRLNASKQLEEESIKNAKAEIKSLKSQLNVGLVDPATNKVNPLEPEEIEKAKKRINELTREIKTHRQNIKDIVHQAHEYESAYAERSKGMSFGSREKLALRSQVIDEDIFDALKTRMGQLGETDVFNETFGNLMDAEGNFIGDKNRPIFSSVLSHISHAQQTKTAYDMFVNDKNYEYLINKHFKSPSIRKEVKAFYNKLNKSKTNPLTVESLERSYFLNQSKLAFDFNTSKRTDLDMIEGMGKLGFKRVTLDDLSFASTGDAEVFEKKAVSPFTQNILLDFEDGDFVAIPYLPHTAYKDEIIQKNYQAHWLRLKDSQDSMKDALKNNNMAEYARAKKLYAKRKESLKQAVNTISYGKDGVINKDVLNYRAPYSMSTKASTAYRDYYGFDEAYYKGRTLREWMDKGIYLDAAFGNEKAFREMGILNQDYLDSLKDVDFSVYDPIKKQDIIVSYAGEEVTEEMLRKKLQVEGIDVFSDRYPTNLEGSLTATKLYLDPHMNNNENRTSLAYWTQIAKNGDNDGDETHFALALFRDAKLNQSFDTYHSQIYKRDFDKGLMLRGASTNAIYASETAEKVDKTYKELIRDNFRNTVDKFALDGSFYSVFPDNPYSHYTETQVAEMKDMIDAIELEMGEKIDASNLKKTNEFLAAKKELTKSVDGNAPVLSEEAYNMMKESVKFKVSMSNISLAGVAKVRGKGGAIGEIDMLSTILREQAEYLYKNNALTKQEFEGIDMISYLLTQKTISSKKSSDIDNVKNIQEFRDILNKAHNNKAVPEIENLEETTRNYLRRNILGKDGSADDVSLGESIALSLRRLNGEDISNEQAYQQAEDAVIKMFGYLDNDTMRKHRRALEIFKKKQPRDNIVKEGLSGIHIQTLDDGTPLDYTDYLYNIVTDVSPDLFKTLDENGIHLANEALTGETNITKDFSKQLERSSKRIFVESSEPLFKDIGKNLNSKVVMGSAVGLAAAYMLTGFMGNNPSTPATTQSQLQSEEEQDQTPILSDYGTDFVYPHQDTGYVINVNADNGLNTKKTQRVIQTMATTLSHSINTDVNINMRIEENTNFDNYTLNRMLTHAFGFK